jgi:ubiquinone/menaquinone biosynthesis C-methylase UbiE
MFSEGVYARTEHCEHKKALSVIAGKYIKNDDDIVVEIGSGKGPLQTLFSKRYFALDYSFVALKKYISTDKRICANAEHLPLKNESVELLFTIETLEHVCNPELAFHEIDRVLKKEGVAYIAPAWHCRSWASKGIPVRPYEELTFKERIIKYLIPLLDSAIIQGLTRIPFRIIRRVYSSIIKKPTKLVYRQLSPNYEIFWMPDSDAACSIDAHEAILYFETRGYLILSHHTLREKIFARYHPVIIKKTDVIKGNNGL